MFDMLTIANCGYWPFGSRKLAVEAKPSFAVILLEPVSVPG